ncbi:hydroxymethylglutaryl-CoA lyase [Massilia sp. TWR1-2-2]|uniref:hydroxymethylglutaryl-CoA lyase n=1 Tax=Massilia sp. TWR1-2-2 TaxID=2804584 RepID=UPI003CF2AFD3
MNDVVICECFARDGLQHEPDFVPTDAKVALIDRFGAIGFERIEATSYSNPAVVPQFGDASDLLRRIARRPGVFYKATCANVRAVERALVDDAAGFGANEISLLASASDSHSERNLRRSRQDQWQNIADMVAAAGRAFRKVGTLSVAFGCPFEGEVSTASVLQDVERFAALGVRHVTLGDTTGMATPKTVKALFGEAIALFPDVTFISHFHDTRGTGLANCMAAFDAGVRYFDSAIGGVGGHPAKVKYGGGHTGNVSTEDLVNLLESEGVRTGIDLAAMLDVGRACEQLLGRQLHSRVMQSGLHPALAPA